MKYNGVLLERLNLNVNIQYCALANIIKQETLPSDKHLYISNKDKNIRTLLCEVTKLHFRWSSGFAQEVILHSSTFGRG